MDEFQETEHRRIKLNIHLCDISYRISYINVTANIGIKDSRDDVRPVDHQTQEDQSSNLGWQILKMAPKYGHEESRKKYL